MDVRTKTILEAAVSEYIRTGEPITSEGLYRRYAFGIKPAMIRWELNALSDAGYLYQRHPSGGRFPTDKAYLLFVRELLEEDPEAETARAARALAEDLLKGKIQAFVKECSDYLNVLSVGYRPAKEDLYESGLSELLNQIEVDRKEDWMQVVNDFESLQDRLSRKQDWWEEQSGPRVFVGSSPITKSDHLSVVAHRFGEGDEQMLVVAIGPKRMDYRKSLRLMRSLENAFDESFE